MSQDGHTPAPADLDTDVVGALPAARGEPDVADFAVRARADAAAEDVAADEDVAVDSSLAESTAENAFVGDVEEDAADEIAEDAAASEDEAFGDSFDTADADADADADAESADRLNALPSGVGGGATHPVPPDPRTSVAATITARATETVPPLTPVVPPAADADLAWAFADTKHNWRAAAATVVVDEGDARAPSVTSFDVPTIPAVAVAADLPDGVAGDAADLTATDDAVPSAGSAAAEEQISKEQPVAAEPIVLAAELATEQKAEEAEVAPEEALPESVAAVTIASAVLAAKPITEVEQPTAAPK
ncbi:MAG TPA: hypothetical protein VF796_11005, partial [Humisphaera sp.]